MENQLKKFEIVEKMSDTVERLVLKLTRNEQKVENAMTHAIEAKDTIKQLANKSN